MLPFFSIIIPVYNVAPYLRECLNSILAQTFMDWEAICVDDGSTDGSGAILGEYAAKDGRFRIFQQTNFGPAHARNFGLREACGQYVLFMDSDDRYFDNGVLAAYYGCVQKGAYNIVGGSLAYLKNGKICDAPKEYCFEDYGIVYFRGYEFDWGFSRYAYKRDFLLDNNIWFPALCIYEDPVFLVSAMVVAKKFYAMNRVVYCYRQRGYSPINISILKMVDQMSGYFDVIRMSKDNGLNTLFDKTVKRYKLSCQDWMYPIMAHEQLWNLSCKINYEVKEQCGANVMREAFAHSMSQIESSVAYKLAQFIKKQKMILRKWVHEALNRLSI